eukprot:TRINITY_DN2924_c0_g1_i14.p2 TRINITY_DN2924_c0_g1~~TRINITY_DN2924_c0_g1_i14.p2  ORF type:complete len:309 (-),score=31.80 TRINITY_DN2924_c0_g1_i14:319-1176(-)
MKLIHLMLFTFLASINAELRVGMLGPEFFVPLPYVGNLTREGQCLPSFLCDILSAVCDGLQEECTIVFMDEFSERTTFITDGLVDLVIDQTRVTPENAEFVHFVRPYYFYAGTTIFVPDTVATKDHPRWADIEGQKVCSGEGYYANEAIRFRYNVEMIEVDLAARANGSVTPAEIISQLGCDYLVTGSNFILPTMAQSVNALIEFGSPQGVAVAHEKRDTLGADISKILIGLMNKGKDSAILDIEKRSFGAVGIPANIKLRDIVQAITDLNGTLPAAVEDAIWDE